MYLSTGKGWLISLSLVATSTKYSKEQFFFHETNCFSIFERSTIHACEQPLFKLLVFFVNSYVITLVLITHNPFFVKKHYVSQIGVVVPGDPPEVAVG